MPISSDIIRGHIDTIILAQLMRGDSYGYEINKTVRRSSGDRFELKEATLYSAFRRLEEDGWIASYWGENEGGARRRYYRITSKGQSECIRQLIAWQETKDILDLLLLPEQILNSNDHRQQTGGAQYENQTAENDQAEVRSDLWLERTAGPTAGTDFQWPRPFQ